MKKIVILLMPGLFSGLFTSAQYSGGSGSGINSTGLTTKHLTNWFQTNGTWSTPENWADGIVPVHTEEANIKAEVTLDGNYTYPLVNISATGTLIVPAGSTLTVDDQLMNNSGNSGLILQNGSSLIHSNAGVPGTMQREVPDADWSEGLDGWHLISSPVDNQQLVNGGFTSAPYDFYAWNETGDSWLNQKTGVNNITAFIPGSGYLVSYENGGTKSFSGTLNVSDITRVNLSKTGNSYYTGYHLLGNPFASSLKWNDGNWGLSNVGGVASVWNETAQNYLSLASPDDIIPANQGFFVQVTDASNSITIPAASRVHSNSPFYKGAPSDFLKLKITCSASSTFDETIVRLNDRATDSFDPEFDSHKMTGSDVAPLLYTLIEPGERAAVNTMGSAGHSFGIAMGFRPGKDDTYTLKAESLTFNRKVILEDRSAGASLTLEPGSVYSFNGNAGDDENRFVLNFSLLDVNGTDEDQAILLYGSGNTVYVRNPGSDASELQIFSLTGQSVFHTLYAPAALLPVNNRFMSPGIYVVQLKTSGNVFRQKMILH